MRLLLTKSIEELEKIKENYIKKNRTGGNIPSDYFYVLESIDMCLAARKYADLLIENTSAIEENLKHEAAMLDFIAGVHWRNDYKPS